MTETYTQAIKKEVPANALYLVDASIYIFRAYFAMPDNWQAKNGYSTQAVYGFAMFLLQLMERANPRYCALAFDESLESCFRNKIYSGYKSSRALPDDALAFQLTSCRQLAEAMGFACFGSKRYEADDLLASLAAQFSRKNRPAVVVSRDKDLGQILQRPEDRLWDFAGEQFYCPQRFQQKHGVKPEQMACYLALVGDNIDDIPGVPGLGPTSAAALLAEFSDLEGLLSNLDEVENVAIRGAKALADKLTCYQAQCLMAKKLTTLVTNVSLRYKRQVSTLKHLDFKQQRKQVSQQRLNKLLNELGFGAKTQTRFARVYGWE